VGGVNSFILRFKGIALGFGLPVSTHCECAFGLLVSITGTGTFGLASYTVFKRLRERIRVALGAQAKC
jgi:hypothetical protein